METLIHDLLTPIVIENAPKPRKAGKVSWLVRILRVYFMTFGRIFPKLVAGQALRLFGKPQQRYHRKPIAAIMDKSQKFSSFSEGLQINGYLWENEGPTVLLVHGWETGGLHLFSFVEPLWALGFRIIAMDGPAHGSSEGSYTNLPHFAAAILSVIKEVGPVNHIIAHSFGGLSSVYMAANNPMVLDKMVLISVPNNLVRIISDFAKYLSIPAVLERKMHKMILEKFKMDPRKVSISLLGKQMNVAKILMVHDRDDQVVPFYNALEVTHELRQACILPCQNLGHNRILKNPQVTTRVAQFLKDELKF